MTHDVHIAIVGAGIGGLTAALCCHFGYRIDVFEQSPALNEVARAFKLVRMRCACLWAWMIVKRTRIAGSDVMVYAPCVQCRLIWQSRAERYYGQRDVRGFR